MNIADALDAAPLQAVQIQLPRWDHRCSFDLRQVLEAAGLQKTLKTTEDFDGRSTTRWCTLKPASR